MMPWAIVLIRGTFITAALTVVSLAPNASHWVLSRRALSAQDGKATSEDRIELIIPMIVLHQRTTPPHYPEILGAIGNNLLNNRIRRVHALVEGKGNASHSLDLCSTFLDQVQQAIAQIGNHLEHNMQKVNCVPLAEQATYEVVFRYASSVVGDRIVMVANADVAFDDSLNLVDSNYVRSRNVGFVLSVTPPTSHELYQRLFGNRSSHSCASENRCNQKKNVGTSFDVFVFKTPLRVGAITNSLDFYMNRNGAENAAASVMTEKGGIMFTNPCQMVKAYHWHCSSKMHFNNKRVKAHGMSFRPCKICPGLNYSRLNI